MKFKKVFNLPSLLLTCCAVGYFDPLGFTDSIIERQKERHTAILASLNSSTSLAKATPDMQAFVKDLAGKSREDVTTLSTMIDYCQTTINIFHERDPSINKDVEACMDFQKIVNDRYAREGLRLRMDLPFELAN